MPHYAIVVKDPATARQAEIDRHVAHNLTHHVPTNTAPAMRSHLTRVIAERVEQMVGPAKQAGDLHAHASSDCPNGLQNCRNCGDPDHEASCRAAGHCPHCGRSPHGHGIAPASVIANSGLELIEVEPPTDGHEWHAKSRSFVKKSQ